MVLNWAMIDRNAGVIFHDPVQDASVDLVSIWCRLDT